MTVEQPASTGSALDIDGAAAWLDSDSDSDRKKEQSPAKGNSDGDAAKATDAEDSSADEEQSAEEEATEQGEEGAEEDAGDDEGSSDDEEQPEDAGESKATELKLTQDAVYMIDGVEVTGAQLKSERMAHSDYTRKTQELSAKVRDLQTASQKAEEQYAKAVQFALGNQKAEFQQFYQSTDWARLQAEDPAKYAQQVQKLQQLKAAAEQSEQGFQQFIEKVKTGRDAQLKQQAQETMGKLKGGAIPGWSNELYGTVRSYAVEQGLPAGDFDNIADLPSISLIWKAMQYDKMSQKPATTKVVKSVKGSTTKKAPPSTSTLKNRGLKDAKARLAKSGSIEDAVLLL